MEKLHKINGMPAGFFLGKSAVQLVKDIKDHKYTAVQLTEIALNEIERLNPILNAFVAIDREDAIQQAVVLDNLQQRGEPLGPLHGIPIAVKDLIFTKGLATTAGSKYHIGDDKTLDAQCIKQLRAAGAVIIGKTLTHEFAYGPTGDRSAQGASLNPWDLTCITGGSSAGSACAVAAGMVPLAIGTDTGGSIRIPSALCGVLGFKPTAHIVSTDGVYPLSSTFDHVGPIANNIEDICVAFEVLKVSQVSKPLNNQGKKVAWIDPKTLGQIDKAIAEQVYNYAKQLSGSMLDATQTMASILQEVQQCYFPIQSAEAASVHIHRINTKPQVFDKEVLERLQDAAHIKGWEYITALEKLDKLIVAALECFEQYDFIMMPTVGITAPKLQQRDIVINNQADKVRDSLLRLTNLWNALGFPAITVPIGTYQGLPIGLQIIAKLGADNLLLNFVTQLFKNN